ncbi:glycosyl hydrolase family 61-domain-containing protein [Mycena galericulata]|nr:glycosyl hydrolase family 61-domain-containing protein [Mycena galericulata]
MKSAVAVLFSVSLIASASAHGWVGTLTVAGKAYKGNEPVQFQPKATASVVRQIADNMPVKDVIQNDIICGRNAQPGALMATAAAGDTILVDWHTLTADGHWFHDMGPMMTYLASCGSASCATFDTTKAKWFKISQQGQDADGNWAQAKLDDGSPASVTLPANLKAGNYLFRHEIIALHTADSLGGAEFYPSCSQLTVTGSGTGAPAASELVTFPGAYTATNPGILIDVYDLKAKYQFPGPPVAAFVSGSTSPPTKGTAKQAATSTSTGEHAKTRTPTTHATTYTSTTKHATTTTSATHSAGSTPNPSKTCKGKKPRSRSRSVPVPPAAGDAPALPNITPVLRRSRGRHLTRVLPRSL